MNTQTMNWETTTVRLSQEELLLLLSTLQIGGLPGMGMKPATDSDQDAAGRALIARGMITVDDTGKAQIDRGVLAAIHVCCHPERMAGMIFRDRQGSVRQRYFYQVPELAVTHTFPLSGIHDLEIAARGDMGAALLAELLAAFDGDSEQTLPYTLDQQLLASVQEDGPSQDHSKAQLVAAGMEAEHAQSLLQALARDSLRLLIQCIYSVAPVVQQRVLSVVAGPTGSWLIQAAKLHDQRVTLQRLPPAGIAEAIRQVHSPLVTHS